MERTLKVVSVQAAGRPRAPRPGLCPVRIRQPRAWLALALLLAFSANANGQPTEPAAHHPIVVVVVKGEVQVSPAGEDRWFLAGTNQVLRPGDRLRTGRRGQAVVRWSNLTLVPLDRNSFLQVPAARNKRGVLQLLKGAIYFFHRDQPTVFPVETPTMAAVVRGTEFNLRVAEDGASVLQMIEGSVEVRAPLGEPLVLGSGEAAATAPGQAPRRTAALPAANVIQWCLYYPGVLDLDELRLSPAEQQALEPSLTAYRLGDLPGAFASYPEGRQPGSASERVYLAALMLTLGQVDEADALLPRVDEEGVDENGASPAGAAAPERLAAALRRLVAAVKGTPAPPANFESPATFATEWLADSYYRQSRADLHGALEAAQAAVQCSPGFGYARVRLAELLFSFGRKRPAWRQLAQGLVLMPRHAEAHALQGFLLAAQNRIAEAETRFEAAMALDQELGNAWLGRGLCRIRQGEVGSGLQDLQVAAALEPQRALLRSYLAKAYDVAGRSPLAHREIAMAQELDPADPTGWFYSALLLHRQHRVNAAVRNLETAIDRNDNRAIYRSRQLLDQDRAVRSANLAHIYRDAGLLEVSAWEASRAVSADYANFSAHLFLANTYQQLRDLRGVNQRYETAAVTEYLLANLLAPVGAETLAQSVSQQEYSKLFEQDGFGVAGAGQYLSRGDWLGSGVQYGRFQNTGYALSGLYLSSNGQRSNHDLEQFELSAQIQQQITPADSVYLRLIYGEARGGDLADYYDPTTPFSTGGPNLQLRFEEVQDPLLLVGYHRQWGPGSHTLVLGGRFADTLEVANPQQPMLMLARNPAGAITGVFDPFTVDQEYRSQITIYSLEAQQLWQRERDGFILGGRFQAGDIETRNRHAASSLSFPFSLFFPTEGQAVDGDFERASVYGYYSLRPVDPLQLVAGLSYDWLRHPLNFRYAPLLDGEETADQVSPKGGLVWTPTRTTTLRGAYTKSLGGVSFEQSFRLEPTQVAGFNQAFRSLAPESVVGANTAAPFETWGISLEQRIGRGTYLGLAGEMLRSDFDRTIGVYDFVPFSISRSSTGQHVDFRERALTFSAYQLLGESWSVGLRYRFAEADLQRAFGDILAASGAATVSPNFQPAADQESRLHQLTLSLIYNHRSGFFARVQPLWTRQDNAGYDPERPGDEFWHFNLFAGYRFWRRQAEVRLGLLNLTDEDYRLNPLNLTPELPRERTLLASFRFYF